MIPNASDVLIGQNVEVVSPAQQTSRTYKIDFETGRIGGYVDGIEAMKQAITLILLTERFQYLIYPWNYGTEMRAAYGKSWPVFQSEIRRVLREALLADERITAVSDIQAEQTGKRSVLVSMTVDTIFGAVPISQEVSR